MTLFDNAMPGCHAWGETPGEAEENLRSMALAFLESYEAHGDELPAAAVFKRFR